MKLLAPLIILGIVLVVFVIIGMIRNAVDMPGDMPTSKEEEIIDKEMRDETI